MQIKEDLSRKVAFIQGGSRGIGAAIARRLAPEGAAVAITWINAADKAKAVVGDMEAAGWRALLHSLASRAL